MVALSQDAKLPCQRRRIRSLHWSVASIAAASVAGTERAATRMGDRAQARNAGGHHYAHVPTPLAFDTDARRRDIRFAAHQERSDEFDQLVLVDRAAVQLKIHRHMFGNGSRRFQSVYVLRCGVDNLNKLI